MSEVTGRLQALFVERLGMGVLLLVLVLFGVDVRHADARRRILR